MQNHKRKILLLVEGKSTEVKLFKKIIECFNEINVSEQDILFYSTNLWVLNNDLKKEFGDNWYEEEIDFIGFLCSKSNIKSQILPISGQGQVENFKNMKFTDVFLIFDYERQDPGFDESVIKKMLSFWNESTENGLLYINYPMVEAYKHLKAIPDNDYLTRQCDRTTLINHKYKELVGSESSFTDLKKYNRNLLKEFVIHNLCKASAITQGTTDISVSTAKKYWDSRDYNAILDVQNQCSRNAATGFVHVLATCLFFIPEYNSNLIF